MFDLPPATELSVIQEKAPKSLFHFLERKPYFPLGAVIKIPPATDEVPYEELRCTPEDREKIYILITTMAKHGKVALLVHHKNALEQIGRELRPVHSLKFLSVILASPELCDAMKKILGDYFKKKNFIEGISPTLDREALKGRLATYLNGFAKEVNIPANLIEPYFNNRNWNDFIEFLFNR